MRTLVIGVALQLWIVLFIGFFGGYLVSIDPGVRLVAQLIAVVPLVVWAAFRLRGPRDGIDAVVGIAVVAHVVVSGFSLDRTGSLEASAMAVVVATLFWLMRDLADRERLRRFAAAAVVAAVVPWLAAVAAAWVLEKAEWIAAGGGIPDLESFQVFIWGTANVLPVLVLLAAAFAAWLPDRSSRLVVWVVIGLLSLVLVPFSAGRAGWLGIIVAVLVLEPLAGGPIRGWVTRRSHLYVARRRWVLGAAMLVMLGGLLRLGPAIAANLESRSRIWSQAIGILLSDPLTGSGPSTFSWARLQHVPDYVDRVPVILSHSVLFQTLADGGLLLTAAFAGVVGTYALAVWKRRKRLLPAQRVGVAVLAGVGAASLLDDFSFLPSVTALVVTLAAWSLPSPSTHTFRSISWSHLSLPVGAVVLAVALVPSVVQVNRARLSADVGRNAAVKGNWEAAESAFRTASNAYPEHPGYHLSLGLVAAGRGNISAALDAYTRARVLSPGDPRGAGGMAAVVTDSAAQIDLLDEATRHSNDPQYPFRLAEALAAAGRDSEAELAMARAIVLQSTLVGLLEQAPFVDAQGAAERLPAAVESTGSVNGLDPDVPLWDAGLWRRELPEDAEAPWQAVSEAVSGDSEAAHIWLDAARDRDGSDARPYLAAAAVARLECEETGYRAAERLGRLLLGKEEPDEAGVAVSFRDRVYREPSLGDYQPPGVTRPPRAARWPQSLIDFPRCDWEP
ncbi:MAG: O-antigen ligase family protein [Chloroflexi bacterium]|nr:O-antigen ligase family protein [Chloroflexota bacterium]